MTTEPWYKSRYTGLFNAFHPVQPRPHDPRIAVCSGVPAGRQHQDGGYAVGGAGFDAHAAELATVGEAIERWRTHPFFGDGHIETCHASWHHAEAAVAPDSFVWFHPQQYAHPEFPFEPLTRTTRCNWLRFRQAQSGNAMWLPAELCYLDLRSQAPPARFAPVISTGWSAHQCPQLALLRGVQEVIERDALMGAWWGRYGVERVTESELFAAHDQLKERLCRPNLRYAAYRIDSPFAAHVTMATVEGADREGFCFSIGSSCRETRAESLTKSLIEAVQGRHYVRYLLANAPPPNIEQPRTFAEHAVRYSLVPEQLAQTPLHTATAACSASSEQDDIAAYAARLQPRPILFRIMTPHALAEQDVGWFVVRVIIPGLQPMHGHHGLPLLGGPIWGERAIDDYRHIPPHPFA